MKKKIKDGWHYSGKRIHYFKNGKSLCGRRKVLGEAKSLYNDMHTGEICKECHWSYTKAKIKK